MMNRSLFLLVFLSGVAFAMVALLISEYLLTGKPGKRTSGEVFIPLPDIVHLSVINDNRENDFMFLKPPPDNNDVEPSKSRDVQEASETCKTNEALLTVNAAIKTNNSPNGARRARKLFYHAMALCPKHPKVLNHFGEFLESTGEDLMEADHLFVRAMAFSLKDTEEHQRALQNRKRTAMVVEEIDRRVLQRIDDKKKTFLKMSASSSAAMNRAKKEAYFQHVYHTVGIEGNTMNLVQTRSVLETKLAVAGKSVMEHNEVLGLDSALRYINQTLVDKLGEITLEEILQIHKRVIGHIDPIEAGMIRRTQVYVGDYVPPPPSNIELLLQRFILWLNSPEALDMHPVKFAALAHYKLVFIHPFVDGNGRTSRLLMNLILMKHGYPPVIIRKQDRLLYYQHLTTANEGDIRPFIRFISDCTEKTLDAFIEASQDHSKHPIHYDASEHGLSRFEDEGTRIFDHFEDHDKIIMGGMVGDNITVTP